MRYFVKNGYTTLQQNSNTMQIITTLYGPPGWATILDKINGRDLDEKKFDALAAYMVNWVSYLRNNEQLPVKYISIHNEGEDLYRWDLSGKYSSLGEADYNAFWRPHQVSEMVRLLGIKLKEQELADVRPTNGEPTLWERFYRHGYAVDLFDNDSALKELGLITSHAFGDNSVDGNIHLLHAKRPDLHRWTTSCTWGNMDVDFLKGFIDQIYNMKVNAIIPWACVQTSSWVGGDPNPGTAIRINPDSTYSIQPGYWRYMHLTRIGKPGMSVAPVMKSPEKPFHHIVAFGKNETDNPDAFMILNTYMWASKSIKLKIDNSRYKKFIAYRTSHSLEEKYKEIGLFKPDKDGYIEYNAPKRSVTTFIGTE
jgi:hypothetical protein